MSFPSQILGQAIQHLLPTDLPSDISSIYNWRKLAATDSPQKVWLERVGTLPASPPKWREWRW
jgi:hypothetical protein